MKMTIEELANKYNKENEKNNNNEKNDKRINDNISSRRIRDYVTKGLISKPLKEGRLAIYTNKHLEELKNIRKLQTEGFSDTYLQKNYTPENQFKINAEHALDSILKNKKQSSLNDNHSYFLRSSLFNKNEQKKDVKHKWTIEENIEIYINEKTILNENNIKQVLLQIKKILQENYND